MTNISLPLNETELARYANSPWIHQHTTVYSPLVGRHGSYPNTGYAFVVNGSASQASINESLKHMRADGWIDRNTRAVIIEFTVCSIPFNLFSNVVIFFEFIGVGRIEPSYRIHTSKLYSLRKLDDVGVLVCGAVCYVLIMMRLVRVVREVFGKYLNTCIPPPVSIRIDLIFILLANICAMGYLLRFTAVAVINNYISRYDYSAFIDFSQVVMYEDMFTHMMSFVLMFAILNALRIVNIDRDFVLLSNMMRHILCQLLDIAVWFFIVFTFIAAILFYLLGPSCYEYHTLPVALMSAASLCVGRPKFAVDNFDVPVLIGQCFVLSATVCVVVLWLPVVRAICMFARWETIMNIGLLRQSDSNFSIWRRVYVWFGGWNTQKFKDHSIAEANQYAQRAMDHTIRFRARYGQSLLTSTCKVPEIDSSSDNTCHNHRLRFK